MCVIGYARLSKARNGSLSLDAQRLALEEACRARGWELVGVEADQASGKSRKRRPGLARAVAACRGRRANGIIAVRLDRLARSAADFSDLLREADAYGFGLTVLDFQIDTTTATGRLVADLIARVAEWEREVIAERTREALAEKRARGWHRRVYPATVRRRIVKRWRDGASIETITRELNARGIEAQGSRWHPTSVQRILRAELGVRRGPLPRV